MALLDPCYEAAKAHAAARGINLTAWPNQQALVADEVRWMRAALEAYHAALERGCACEDSIGSDDFLAFIAMNPQGAADAHERAMTRIRRLEDALRWYAGLDGARGDRARRALGDG